MSCGGERGGTWSGPPAVGCGGGGACGCAMIWCGRWSLEEEEREQGTDHSYIQHL